MTYIPNTSATHSAAPHHYLDYSQFLQYKSEITTFHNILLMKPTISGVYPYLPMVQLSHDQFRGYFLKMEI